jgi:thiosulfate/3-mercaptopyruvate sulfurtransferase
MVNAKWLQGNLTNPNVAVVHVAASAAEYDAGHIPGARLVLLSSIAPQLGGLSLQLPPIATTDSVLESVGISDGQHIVLYGQPLNAARAFVTLERAGLQGNVSVLDGGMDAWRESGRVVSFDAVSPVKGTLTVREAANVVDAEWLSANRAAPGIAVLDARLPEFYQGLSPGSTARPGRVPGARNVPFSFLTSELTTFRKPGQIQRLFAQARVAKGDTVITYCHIGLQASLLYLASRSQGHPTRIYDGSWEDWAKRSELPAEKGRN